MRKVQGNRRLQVLQFLAKGVGQPREPMRVGHPFGGRDRVALNQG